jgi:hypothetical protein
VIGEDQRRGMWWAVCILAIVIAVVLFGYIYFVLPGSIIHGPKGATKLDLENKVRTSGIQLLGVLFVAVGTVLTAWSAGRTLWLNREGQLTERFAKAIEQVGADKQDVRVGGIYALGRLAARSQVDQGPVIEILTAYLQKHAPWPPAAEERPTKPAYTSTGWLTQTIAYLGQQQKHEPAGDEPRLPMLETQAVATFLTRRKPKHDGLPTIDLSAVDLRGVSFSKVDLSCANLAEANLDGARLENAILNNANLTNARLRGAAMSGARLIGANLTGAQLNGAYLDGADLNGADVTDADLRGANLERTKGGRLTEAIIDRQTRLPS